MKKKVSFSIYLSKLCSNRTETTVNKYGHVVDDDRARDDNERMLSNIKFEIKQSL